MDKSWISSNRLSNAYDEGVNAFLEFAQSNNPKLDVIPCPCVNCINLCHHSIGNVCYHLFAHGFDENYKIWSFHGEKQPKSDSRCPNNSIPLDAIYTKDMLHDAFKYVDEELDSLKSLLEECDKPPYVGSKYNSLSGLLKFQHLKGQFGWSDASFDALLSVLKDILPSNNIIPSSIYESKKLLKGEHDFMPQPSSGEDIYDYLVGFETTWGKKIKSKKVGSKKIKSKKGVSKKETPKKEKSKKKKESIDERSKFWHKKSILFELEYWKKLPVRHQLDLMYIQKNVTDSLYWTALDLPHKTKDGLKARQDLEALGIKTELRPQPKGDRHWIPPAKYTLNSAEKHLFYDTLSNIKVPHGYCSNFKNLVSDDVSKMNGLKSNDCHVLMQQFLHFAIKGVLDVKVRRTILSL
ncbi:unnamed protein product [Lactuca virosa]|uniref:Transposase-associated domain-containing protein n=1 Tax=Lactuca virosa TaxID=75947 RepID=A0AAU9PUB0_9ASTR|nr:unnamed protein product [Lactuca virosa]